MGGREGEERERTTSIAEGAHKKIQLHTQSLPTKPFVLLPVTFLKTPSIKTPTPCMAKKRNRGQVGPYSGPLPRASIEIQCIPALSKNVINLQEKVKGAFPSVSLLRLKGYAFRLG